MSLLKILFIVPLFGLVLSHASEVDVGTIKNVKSPQTTQVADLNGDGLQDIVSATLNDEVFTVYVQNASKRSFEKVQTINIKDIDKEAFTLSFELGHFNHDQHIDMMVMNEKKRVYYYVGKGDGTFEDGKLFPGLPFDQLVYKAELNADGKADLLFSPTFIFAGNIGVTQLISAHTDSKQNFDFKNSKVDVKEVLAQNNIHSDQIEADYLMMGEFNGDQHKDLAVVCGSDDFVIVLSGQEDRTFKFYKFFQTGGGPAQPAALDINNDGIDELIVAHMKEDYSLVYSFDAEEGLRFQQRIMSGRYTSGFSLVKRKEKNYLVALNYFTGHLQFFHNWKKTYFERLATDSFQVALKGIWLNSADLDADGVTDHVITDFRGSRLNLIYGQK